MKNRYLIVLVTFCFPLLAISQKLKVKEDVIKDICFYSNTGRDIVQKTILPLGTFTVSDKKEDIELNFPTEIHEHFHHINTILSTNNENKWYYYFNNQKIFKLTKLDVPNSKIIIPIVDEELKNKSNRYKLYIEDTLVVRDSQKNGIYGLLDEFSAYYQSAKCNLELKGYLEKEYGYNDESIWIKYLTQNSDVYAAYYEFNLFLIHYLQILEQKYPDNYNQIINDKELSKLLSYVEVEFNKVINEYQLSVNNIKLKISDNIEIRDGFIYSKKNMSTGYLLPDNYLNFLDSKFGENERLILNKVTQ